MTASIRYTTLRNATGDVITLDTVYSEDGKDYGIKVFRRIFSAADVGTDAGKTRHANGCPLVWVSGATIREVLSFQLFRPGVDGDVGWNFVQMATTNQYFKYGYKNNSQGGLYFKDWGSDATTQVAENDFVVFSILIGNY